MSATPEIPATAREVRVAAAPAGSSRPGLVVAQAPVPVPGPGQVLVRNRYFHVYAALRTLLAGSVPGAPFPGLNPGDVAIGPAVGEVVSAPAASGLQAGGLVLHYLGWREYAVVDAAACEPVDGDLPDPAAYLAQGTTAYAALNQVAPVRPGDTVFVSGGAGSVGSMAGPIARLLGAQRVIGSTGSAAKAGWMTGELGYDAVVIRGRRRWPTSWPRPRPTAWTSWSTRSGPRTCRPPSRPHARAPGSP